MATPVGNAKTSERGYLQTAGLPRLPQALPRDHAVLVVDPIEGLSPEEAEVTAGCVFCLPRDIVITLKPKKSRSRGDPRVGLGYLSNRAELHVVLTFRQSFWKPTAIDVYLFVSPTVLESFVILFIFYQYQVRSVRAGTLTETNRSRSS